MNTPQDWTLGAIEQADTLRSQAGALFAAAQVQLDGNVGFRVAGAVPLASDQARAVDDLVAAGRDGVAADGDLAAVARIYVAGSGSQAKIAGRLLSVLSATAGPLSDADQRLHAAADRLTADEQARLAGPLAQQVSSALDVLRRQVPRVDAAATLAQVLPAALGAGGSKTYMLALPNPAELRPDGGLSAFIGLVRFVNGNARGLQVNRDSVYTPLRPCYAIPTVLAYYLKFVDSCLDLGDAGWSPDFPTTARLIEDMLAAKTGLHVDGVIALDPYAISSLLRIIGPITVPTWGTFTADNLLQRLEVIVNVNLDYGVMGSVSSALLNGLLGSPLSRWPALVTALQDSAAQRHLQLQVNDAALERLILAGSDGGAVEPAGGADYLMVVDANVSPSKADLFMTKRCAVKTTIQSSGATEQEVDAIYTYPKPAKPSVADKVLNQQGVYRDYVRFLIPRTATVTDIEYLLDGKPASAAAQPLEQLQGLLAVGMFFELPRGHTGEVRLRYSDNLAATSPYNLLIQKQAGMLGRPTDVTITYPGGRSRLASPLTQDARFSVPW